jgi:hypothetical protein
VVLVVAVDDAVVVIVEETVVVTLDEPVDTSVVVSVEAGVAVTVDVTVDVMVDVNVAVGVVNGVEVGVDVAVEVKQCPSSMTQDGLPSLLTNPPWQDGAEHNAMHLLMNVLCSSTHTKSTLLVQSSVHTWGV